MEEETNRELESVENTETETEVVKTENTENVENVEKQVEKPATEKPISVADYLKYIESQVGVIKVQASEDISDIINSTPEERRGWTPEECANNAVELSKYLVYVNNCMSKFYIKKDFCKTQLSFLHGKYASNYGDKFTKFEERVLMLEADNEKAVLLKKIMLDAESSVRELSAASYQLKYLVDSLSLLAGLKGKNVNN